MNDFSLFLQFSSSLDYIGSNSTTLVTCFQIHLKAGNKKALSFTIYSCHMIWVSSDLQLALWLFPFIKMKNSIYWRLCKSCNFPLHAKNLYPGIDFDLWSESHFIYLLLLAVTDRYRRHNLDSITRWPKKIEGWCWNPGITSDWLWALSKLLNLNFSFWTVQWK